MKILGIKLQHPSQNDLVLTAFFVIAISVFESILDVYHLIPSGIGWPTVVAVSTGAILASFGVSIASHGWRAVVVLAAASSIVWCFVF